MPIPQQWGDVGHTGTPTDYGGSYDLSSNQTLDGQRFTAELTQESGVAQVTITNSLLDLGGARYGFNSEYNASPAPTGETDINDTSIEGSKSSLFISGGTTTMRLRRVQMRDGRGDHIKTFGNANFYGEEVYFGGLSRQPKAGVLKYESLSSAFTVGATVTGQSSGDSFEIYDIEAAGAKGSLFNPNNQTGKFTDGETITDNLGGSATADGEGGEEDYHADLLQTHSSGLHVFLRNCVDTPPTQGGLNAPVTPGSWLEGDGIAKGLNPNYYKGTIGFFLSSGSGTFVFIDMDVLAMPSNGIQATSDFTGKVLLFGTRWHPGGVYNTSSGNQHGTWLNFQDEAFDPSKWAEYGLSEPLETTLGLPAGSIVGQRVGNVWAESGTRLNGTSVDANEDIFTGEILDVGGNGRTLDLAAQAEGSVTLSASMTVGGMDLDFIFDITITPRAIWDLAAQAEGEATFAASMSSEGGIVMAAQAEGEAVFAGSISVANELALAAQAEGVASFSALMSSLSDLGVGEHSFTYIIEDTETGLTSTAATVSVTVMAYTFMADVGADDSSFNESLTDGVVDIFEDKEFEEDNLITGGLPPFTVVRDSGDAELTIPNGATPATQHEIVVEREIAGTYSITFTATDSRNNTLQVTHGVVVNSLVLITAAGDTTIVETDGSEPYDYNIPAGEPRGPYTFTINPAAIENSAPTLLGTGAQKLVARGYIEDNILISALFQSDADATGYTFTRTWYDGADQVIATDTPLIVPSGGVKVTEEVEDQFGLAISTAYVQIPLTVSSPQNWISNVSDPNTYDAAQHFGGGSGPKTYSLVSDTTESLSINPTTGQLTISGSGIGEAVIRATDSLTPTAQTQELTLNINRQAASTALAYPMLGQSNQIGKAPYDENGLHASQTSQWTSEDALVSVTGSMLDHKNGHVLTDMGPSITFSDELRANSALPIHFIPAAEGATGIGTGDWAKGGANYNYAVARMNAYTAATGNNFDCVMMNVGGRDARTGHEDTFAANAAQMMADMRSDVAGIGPTTPFVWVEVLEVLAEDAVINDQLAILVASEPYTVLVPASDLDGIVGDNIHFDAPSLRILGERYYAGVLAAKGDTPPGPATWSADFGDQQITVNSRPPIPATPTGTFGDQQITVTG